MAFYSLMFYTFILPYTLVVTYMYCIVFTWGWPTLAETCSEHNYMQRIFGCYRGKVFVFCFLILYSSFLTFLKLLSDSFIYTGCGMLTSFFIWIYPYEKGSYLAVPCISSRPLCCDLSQLMYEYTTVHIKCTKGTCAFWYIMILKHSQDEWVSARLVNITQMCNKRIWKAAGHHCCLDVSSTKNVFADQFPTKYLGNGF
jgi:hypothetical protein